MSRSFSLRLLQQQRVPWRRWLSEYTRDHLSKVPQLAEGVFVAPNATVMGNVELSESSSVWYHAVVRADLNAVRIGARSNVQDGVVVHVTRSLPVTIGEDVSIGHHATLHGCSIGNKTLIGMGAVVLDGCRIGNDSIVGANALCPQNKTYPDRSLILGSPAKAIRQLTDQELDMVHDNAKRYVQYALDHLKHNIDEDELS